MERDNFDLIKEYIKKNSPNFGNDKNEYYTFELIRRGKDNPELPAANYHFKNYYIDSFEKFDIVKNEIISLCKLLNLRAYFAVNKKSYSQVMMNTVVEMARRVAVHDYKKPYAIYESCSGKYFDTSDKKWTIDIDNEADEKIDLDDKIRIYVNAINDAMPKNHSKILMTVPTINRMHLITHPFNVTEFNNYLQNHGLKPHSDTQHQIIKKNHLTLAYYAKNE